MSAHDGSSTSRFRFLRERPLREWVRLAVKWGLFALIMGAVGGLTDAALGLSCDWAMGTYGSAPWLVLLLPLAGVATVWLYHRLGVDFGTRTSTVVDAARNNRGIDYRLAPAIFLGTCATVLCGGSVGKEAAALQFGGSLGSKIGDLLGFEEGFARLFVLSGMAAAFSALLYAPVAAAVFVIEVARLRLSQWRHYLPILLASFSAYAVARLFDIDVLGKTIPVPAFSWKLLLLTLTIVCIVSLAGSLFCICLRHLRSIVARIPHGPWLAMAAGGLLVAVFTLVFGLQDIGGTGSTLIEAALDGASDPLLFVEKFCLTVAVLSCGFKGGEIMPSFAMGATLAAALAVAFGVSVPFAAALGLIAMFCSISNCPLASILLGIEFFGFGIAGYLICGCALCYALTHRISLFDNQEHMLPHEGGRHISPAA